MSSKSRKVGEHRDQQSSELESQRVRTALARSSTTLRRAPPSDDENDAIQASIEAAFAELDHLEIGPAPRAAPPSPSAARIDARRRMPPLPKTPPPLPKQMPPLPRAAAPMAEVVAKPPSAALPKPERRGHWLRRLLGR